MKFEFIFKLERLKCNFAKKLTHDNLGFPKLMRFNQNYNYKPTLQEPNRND